MKSYYRIKTGYGKNEFISIGEDELESAIYSFMSDTKGVFSAGVVRGKDIISITPDYHKALGLVNTEWELDQDDWAEVAKLGIKVSLTKTYEQATSRVKYFIKTKQENLIGTNVKIETKQIENNEDKVIKDIKDEMLENTAL